MSKLSYILCIILSFHLVSSLNVDELCAKRCLYGRGGILCSCNAMHFNGKRSGYIADHAHNPYNDFSIISPNKEIIIPSARGNSMKHFYAGFPGRHITDYEATNEADLDASLSELSLEQLLAKLEENNLSEISDKSLGIGSKNPDLNSKNNPKVFSRQTDNSESEDLERRKEAISRIKEIMRGPYASTSDTDISAESLDHIVDVNNADISRQRLGRLGSNPSHRVHNKR